MGLTILVGLFFVEAGAGSGVSGNAGNAHIWQEPPAGTWH